MNTEHAVRAVARFLSAVGVSPPKTVPKVLLFGSFVRVLWPQWNVTLDARGRIVDAAKPLPRSPWNPARRLPGPPASARALVLARERAEKIGRALGLPASVRPTKCSAAELVWERPLPGGYPAYDGSRATLLLRFDPDTGAFVYAASFLNLFDGVSVPPVRTSSDESAATVRRLLAPLRLPPPVSADSPATLVWAPRQKIYSSESVGEAIRRAGRARPASGRDTVSWRLVWLVTAGHCQVGVEAQSGRPIYFRWLGPVA